MKLGFAVLLFSASMMAGTIGPAPYLSFDDSPFKNLNFDFFYLENFEDGALNTPGVTANGVVTSSGFYTDSVDGDDGAIDGHGSNGRSYYAGDGGTGLTFVFDAAALGGLPTHAGVVWTDLTGFANVFAEAFDQNGVSLGLLGPYALNDGVSTGETAEDRFFGFTNSGGITSLHIYQSSSDMEVDHLQYGRATTLGVQTPEGSTMWLVGLGLLGVGLLRKR